jgi:hypothetical protein
MKHQRIAEQFTDLAHELFGKLNSYYRGDAGEAAEIKRRRADKLLDVLSNNFDAHRFPELLYAMMPDSEEMHASYMRVDMLPAAAAAGRGTSPSVIPGGGVSLQDLLKARSATKGTDQGQSGQQSVSERARRFADAVVGGWVGQMRAIPRHTGMLRYLGLAADVAEMLSEELVAAAIRTDLPDRLSGAFSNVELVTSKRRAQVVEEQVLIAERALADFIMYLGALDRPRIANSFMPERQVFCVTPSVPGVPNLEEDRENQQRIIFMTDWLTMLHNVIIENAGFQDVAEITLEQNARLGGIIRQLAAKG